MIKCSTEAYEKCQEHCHHCKTPDEAYFIEGSDCDKFNQQINIPPMTNADRIRAMSDKELADWLARTQIANVAEALAVAKIPYELEDGLKDEVAKDCMEWLKQPVEG